MKKHGEMKVVHFASYYRWLTATQYIGFPTEFSGSVLDIGANDGYFLSQIHAPFKIGMDLNLLQTRPRTFVQADAQRLPLRDNSQDSVFAFDILEHVENPGSLLLDAVRVLKWEGTFWFSTTAHKFRIFPGGYLQARLERGWGHVRRGYTQDEILSMLSNDLEVEVFLWNEPFFRFFYLPLKALSGFSTALVFRLLRRMVILDSRYVEGISGHVYARVTKHG